MRRLLVLALVAATSFAAPASASKPDPMLDFACGFVSMTEFRPQASYDAQFALLDGGPVTQSGTLTCTIKVNVVSHAAPYEHGASASATGTDGVTVLPYTPVSYVDPGYYPIYLCDQFTDTANVTWYLDGWTYDWTTDAGAECRIAIYNGDGPPTFDPVADFVESLFEAIAAIDEEFGAVIDPARQALCSALAALSPGMPPLVDVRSDGDTYLTGDLVVDCAPYGAPGDAVDLDRGASLSALAGIWPVGAPRMSGVIRVSDTGGGPEWDVAGTLVSVDWDCAADGAGVVCDWDGYFAKPACTEANAVAAVLAADAQVRTRVSCVRGTVVESATTGVASSSLPVTYAERGTTALPVTSLRCEADDGAGGPPVAPYVTTCGFLFG